MSWKRVTSGDHPMSRHAADVQERAAPPLQERAAPPLLPADHVLSSGAVLFPGAFDQHGCPLVVFPVGGQDKLASQLSTAEVMDFIKYFQYQHNKKQEKPNLVSVVADLREASFPTISFIVETLLLLQLQKRMVHTVYVLEPRKKDVCKQLLKLLAPSQEASFKRILLREVPELHNYIDRSQLPWSLGGYLLYHHQSWVTFVKEVDVFAQQFVSVVQRLPSCISNLQALSRLPLPPTLSELQQFLLTADAKFQHLRRELGLEELLRSCESLVEKLRCPDRELCYRDMAGTTLFTHTAFDMVQNHSRITAAVDRVESLWQQLFSKAHLQLQVLQLREDALQITEKIEALRQKIQSYEVEVAKDSAEAAALLCDFEASVHAPAMALVHWADDVIQTSEVLPVGSRPTERWAVDLRRLKDKLESAVNSSLRTLRAVCSYHHAHTKASCWYSLVLYQNFIQELLSGLHGAAAPVQLQQKGWGMVPAWRCRLSTFLKKNPPPEVEELLYLAHLADAIPDEEIQQAGRRLSQRCLILRDLLTSSGPVPVRHLQLALQWQYELLSSSHVRHSAAAHTKPLQPSLPESSLTKCEGGREAALLLGASSFTVAEGKPPSFSSFDSGFDGAVNSPLEALAGREGLDGARDVVKAALKPPQIHEIISSVSDSGVRREEPDSGSLGNSSEADSLHPELQLKCSPTSSNNPWLGLPVDDLENSYTASRTQNPAPQQHLHFDSSDAHLTANQTRTPRDAQREVLSSPDGPPSWDWTLHSQSAVEHPELSPIGNILSSTIIEGGDESICSTEGIPTLLWDSYDLHLNPHDGEAASSEEDWDLREQEGLREVEKILDKANQILAEEENVLAQEAELDALLRSEDGPHVWRLCEDQLGTDFLDSAGSDRVGELTSAESACETKSAGGELSSEAAGPQVPNSADLLTELRTVHILDKLITEENVKIHELQCCPEGPSPVALSVSGEGDASRLQLEREEKSSKEGCKVEKDKEVVPGKQSKGTKDQSRRSTDESLITCLTKLIPVVSDLQEPSEEALHQYVCGEELDGSGENAALCSPEDSKTRPDDGTRTPLLPPVSEPPMVSLPVSEGLAELRTHSAEVQNVSLGSSRRLVPNPNVMEHGNNNCALPEGCGASLQLLSETITKEQRPTCSLQLSLQPEEVQLCSDQPLEFDPGGGDEPNDRLPDGVRISEALRTSYSWSPGSQTQFHSHVNETADLKSTMVLDTGSGLMKAGFADQDLPSVVFPTVIGLPKYEEILNGSLEREAYIGHDAQHMRGVLTLKHPIKNGIIHNWDEMEKIWHHTFQQLGVEPEDHPVLLTEAAMNPLKNREHMVEIMFECFNVPLTYVAMQAVLALYAAGRTTGVVFDSGDGVSHSVPVFEGYCLPHAVQCFPLAGSDVTMYLKKLLQEQGVCMRTTAEEEIVREMKEQCCCVALNYEDELSHGGPSCREVHYTLPDGQVVTLSTERFRAPEILFNPGLIGRDHYGMHESIFKSVLSADIDLRRCLLGNIVLSGGNTLLPGLPDRLQAEIRGLLPTDMVGSVCISSPTDRDFSVWRGGAVLAGSSTFTSAWISREDFEEYGPQIVFRKCF